MYGMSPPCDRTTSHVSPLAFGPEIFFVEITFATKGALALYVFFGRLVLSKYGSNSRKPCANFAGAASRLGTTRPIFCFMREAFWRTQVTALPKTISGGAARLPSIGFGAGSIGANADAESARRSGSMAKRHDTSDV